MRDGWRGIFTIAATPFDERGALLYDELARHVDWVVRAGSHGVVWPVNYSEVSWLTAEERHRGMAVVAGRWPVGCRTWRSRRPGRQATAFTRRGGSGGRRRHGICWAFPPGVPLVRLHNKIAAAASCRCSSEPGRP